MMRTANPALSDRAFSGVPRVAGGEVMTLDGTINKSVISVGITIAAACFAWSRPEAMGLIIPALIAGLVVSLIIIFKQTTAPFLTPVYAVCEGVALGAISFAFELKYSGIVVQAVALTFGTLFALLMAYKSGLIKATENFKLGVVAATGAIFLFYLVTMVLSLFGYSMSFMHGSGALSIGISAVVTVIAALNLVLDFDFIEKAADSKSMPKYMEWFAAFGLLVTLVWLYLEILRLLAKLQDRR